MNSTNKKCLATALMTLCLLTGSLWAAQRSQPRVLSNEDVESSPPPAAAEAPAPGQESETPEAGQPAAASTGALSTPQTDLKRATEMQSILERFYEEVAAKVDDEKDPELQKRWINMSNSLTSLMLDNKKTIEELQAKVPKAAPQPGSEQTEAPAQTEPQPGPQ